MVAFIQGITSDSTCPNGDGFLDKAPAWIEPYLDGDPIVKSKVNIRDYVYYDYYGGYCKDASGTVLPIPEYKKSDTCLGDIDGVYFDRLKQLVKSEINKYPGAKVTLVAHSQGGFIASYFVAKMIQDDPDFVRDHIASVITFDSFPEGLPFWAVAAAGSYFDFRCGGVIPVLGEWNEALSVAKTASQAAMSFWFSSGIKGQVYFYTLDAPTFDPSDPFNPLNSPVLGLWTDIRGQVYGEQIPNTDHSTIWCNTVDPSTGKYKCDPSSGTLREKELVGCAVMAVDTCNYLHSVTPILQGQTLFKLAPVQVNSPSASMTVSWSGSTIRVTPITPSGVRIDPSNLPPGATHSSGPNFETYEFPNPEPGDWKLELYGESIPPEGENYTTLLDIQGPPNEPPLADAGGPYQGNKGEVITLDASKSLDPDGSIVSYEWDLNGDGVYDAQGVTTNLSSSNSGTFFVGLRVTDNLGDTDTTTAEVVVQDNPPFANAGPDQVVAATVGVTGAAVTLDGTGSSDPDNDPLTFSWSALPGITFDDPTSPTPTAAFPLGTTTATLVVNDGTLDSAPDTVDVTVLDSSTCPDDVIVSNYQVAPSNNQFVEIANVSSSPISLSGCSLVTYNVFTESSIGAASVALSGVLFPGQTTQVNFNGVLPGGPAAIGIYNVTPPPPDGTPFSSTNEITGMVYLSQSTVFGVSHLTVPSHNTIYDCIYGGHGTGPFNGQFQPLGSCFP